MKRDIKQTHNNNFKLLRKGAIFCATKKDAEVARDPITPWCIQIAYCQCREIKVLFKANTVEKVI